MSCVPDPAEQSGRGMEAEMARRVTMQEKESTLIRSALAVLLERAGGSIAYTEAEYAGVRARRGEYAISGWVDRSGPGEPVIRVELIPDTNKASMPVC
jgi:hypothetical protein